VNAIEVVKYVIVLICAVEARSPTRRVRTTIVSVIIQLGFRRDVGFDSHCGATKAAPNRVKPMPMSLVDTESDMPSLLSEAGVVSRIRKGSVTIITPTIHTTKCQQKQSEKFDDVQQHIAWTLVKISPSQSFAMNAVKKGKIHMTVTCSDSVS
jgi:hypothetical protein